MTELEVYDIAIVGCGPAGLSAAVNAAIRRKKLILFGGEFCTSKMDLSPRVDNYLGRPGVTGEKLHGEFVDHVKRFNFPMIRNRVQNIFPDGERFNLAVKDRDYKARTVLLTVGMSVAKLLDGEEALVGRGVSYCATCDGPLYRNKSVAMVDYTREGEDEAVFMADFCSKVYYVCMHKQPPKFNKDNIEMITGDKPVRIVQKDRSVGGLELKNRALEVNAVFIFREAFPPQELLPGLTLDNNHIRVNRDLETNIPGVYAAGDCTGKPYQMAKSVGEGQVAVLNAVAYLDHQKH
ncbi:MAG: NAD(P)/FAD-dependent oxidoreductase [Clostridia bacterium]|nr:NAD(P)/FAD-dependent oxidoreductase [Clostridia bacterium]MDQ7790736.1 NAD(P)/FAD-dependent oxidoreductase [Clostridia bacterium]